MCLKSAVVSGVADNLALVKTDAGTEYGNINYAIGNADCRKSLRCNLTEALAGDERAALIVLGASLGKSHHKDTEKYGEVILLTLVA